MLKVLEAKNIALDFLQLIEVCQGKNIDGISLVRRENLSDFHEIITLKNKALLHEIQFRKDIDDNFISASLNSFYYSNGKIVYINSNFKDIKMEFEEDGEKLVTFKDSKNNFNNSRIIKIMLNQFGQIKSTRIKRTDEIVVPEIAGIGKDIIGRIFRILREKDIEKKTKLAKADQHFKC